MERIIANSGSNNCGNPTSSNCTMWNSKNPPCIPVCSTDTVGDVVYKLGQEICYVQGLTDMSSLDLSCFYTPCPSCQNPSTITGVLQIMINFMCAQQTQINNLQAEVNRLKP